MEQNVKQVIKRLERQYQTRKYGKLHKTLLKNGINTELYVGIGIEMYYPDVYNPLFVLHVFDDENKIIFYSYEPLKDQIIKKVLEVINSLGYSVYDYDKLSEKERKIYFGGD